MSTIKAHSIAFPSRPIDHPKCKIEWKGSYTVADLKRTWRKARLINRMVKGSQQ